MKLGIIQKSSIALIILVLVVLSACQSTTTGQAIQNKPVKIGAVLTLSSWGSYWGEGAQRGIELAQQEINKNNQEKVKVSIEDSQTSSSGAIQAANKLLYVDNVDIMYSEFTGPSASIASLVNKEDKVLLYSAFPTNILQKENNTLKTYFSDYDECARLAKHAVSKNKKRIAFVSLNLAFAQACKKGIEDSIEGTQTKLVSSQLVDISETDFKTNILKIKEAKADVIIAILYEDHAINFLKQKTALKLDINFYCGGKNDCITDKVINQVGKENLKGTTTFDLTINEEFIKKYTEKYPHAQDVEIQAAALAYDSIQILYELKRICKTKECILDQAEKRTFNTVVSQSGFQDQRLILESQLEQFNGEEFIKI